VTTRPIHTHRYLARLTIEFETAFIIGGGQDDLLFDDVFVADANGLPTLPGSSLAGVLRHAWADAGYGNENDLFGYQDGDDGHGSRISVSWGCIHDSHNRPVEGILADRKIVFSDSVLRESMMTTARDHVRINHRGTAADKGKFDERSVSAGHRFTFELLLEGSEQDQDTWRRLLSLLCSESMRIGGKSRRGYGQFKVISLKAAQFDLSTDKGFDDFCNCPVSLRQPCQLPEILNEVPVSEACALTAELCY